MVARTPSPAAADLEPSRAAAPTQSQPVAMGAGERAGDGGGAQDPGPGCGARALGALCLLLSVGSAAACLLLGAQAAALHGRVEALEQERELLRRAGPSGSLAAWAETHLERLLREVRERDRRPGDVPLHDGVQGCGGGVVVTFRSGAHLVDCTGRGAGGLAAGGKGSYRPGFCAGT